MHRTSHPGRRLTLALILALAALGGCERFARVAPAQVDRGRQAAAQQFATRILEGWNKNDFRLLGDEAAAELRRTHNDVPLQKRAAGIIQRQAGAYESMVFHELMRSSKHDVYRFKAVFSGAPSVEVRVVYDRAGKVAGFWVRPWRDQL